MQLHGVPGWSRLIGLFENERFERNPLQLKIVRKNLFSTGLVHRRFTAGPSSERLGIRKRPPAGQILLIDSIERLGLTDNFLFSILHAENFVEPTGPQIAHPGYRDHRPGWRR